jgi:hypothetical protein
MRSVLILLAAIILAGCATPKDDDFHIELVKQGPDKAMLEISHRAPVDVGGDGTNGFTAMHKVTYWAALSGPGPTFVNPHFADVPEEYHCVGTISLDLEHEMVNIDLRRIVSKPDELLQTVPHPANGLHRIEKIKEEKHGWWF